MEANKKRHIRDGLEFDHLFPDASVDTHTIMRHAGVTDTVNFIPKVIGKTLDQTRHIAGRLKGSNDFDTCRKIWHFVYDHINYRKDKDGYEQIRSPARTWHDRKAGVDCDCYSTFISSILTNLGIPYKLRITKYNHDYYQHIYPVAVLAVGRQVVIDCVTDRFNYEVPFSEKKDYPMDLQYLDGIDTEIGAVNGDFDGTDLGKHSKHKKSHHHKNGHETFEDFMNHPDDIPAYGVKKKKGFKRFLSFVNKVNPATAMLRNGVLASMKLNIGAAAKRLRWSYLTPNQAKNKGMDIAKWKKLVQVRQKLDNIFYGAGGKPENLKKAVLKGKGNKDKAIHGLDGLGYDHEMHHMNIHTPLHKVLGHELFYEENEGIHAVGDLGDLGEPVTLASITAASGIIALIVKMIKKVGDVTGGKGENSSDFDPQANADAESSIPGADKSGGGSGDDGTSSDGASSQGDGANASDDNGENNSDDMNTAKSKTSKSLVKSGSTDITIDKSTDDPFVPSSGDGFWEKNKKWLLPASIGVGGIAAIAIGMHMMHGSKGKPIHGVPKRKNHHRKAKARPKPKAKPKGKKKKSVSLM